MSISSPPNIQAQKIINELDIKYPSEIKVKLIAETLGVTVVEDIMMAAEGRLVRLGNKGKITIPGHEINEGRKRFSIGHELGHFVMHSDLTNIVICDKKDMTDWKSYKKRETEANQFSAALLMPENLFLPSILRKKANMKLIKDLASDYRTSLTATAVRYIQLTKEPCALVFSRDGFIQWFMKNDADFNYYLKGKGQPVDKYSFAYDSFRGKGDYETGSLVSASAWAESEYVDYSDMEIFESTVYLKYYNSTLTLLWEN